jgi:DNA-binding NarL/FixJ family response regulator
MGELTNREIQVAELVAAGRKNSDIAAALNLEEQTVKNYICGIYRKLDLRNRVQLALCFGTPGFPLMGAGSRRKTHSDGNRP